MKGDEHKPVRERSNRAQPAEKAPGTDLDRHAEVVMQRMKDTMLLEFSEFIALLKRPWRLMWTNFLVGMARGTGIAVGISIVGAIVVSLIYILLKKIVTLPLVGEFVADIVDAVRDQMQRGNAM